MKNLGSLICLAFTILAVASPWAAGAATSQLPPGAVDRAPDATPAVADPAQLQQSGDAENALLINEGEIKRISKQLDEIDRKRAEKSDSLEKTLQVTPFVRSEVRELAFEADHTQMLELLRTSSELVGTMDSLYDDAKKCATEVAALSGKAAAGQYVGLKLLKSRVDDLQAKILTDLTRLRAHKAKVNDTLIENVHRYNLKLSFRKCLGITCISAFSVMIGIFSFLLWKKTLAVDPGATMQFIAVILIVFVILFFGITDVMGENGVTGLLAAIAGYILGKTTSGQNVNTQHMAEIIRAVQGLPPVTPTEG